MVESRPVSKPPQPILDNVWAFSPNRETLGGTAYFLIEDQTNILIDTPAWDEVNRNFIEQQGGLDWLVITHRESIGNARKIQQATECHLLIQEQEAYLIPEATVTSFQQEFTLTPHSQMIWTPGHSPGSSCLYSNSQVGILFSGRHLLPNLQGLPVPLRTAKTFHWPRQIQSVKRLIEQFSQSTLQFICPGANTGALRGKRVIDQAYDQLASLDLEALLQTEILL
ncbi:metallo-beta-lactamase superfamily protein [Lyngbya aestuarii BL J]|uniref:Metallo-beta-lactamase superfamily protein n=1 Tax=Lyngbya aestuarii BL J TaxID=1348334 RepID=U7QMA7_9CYAN|nr:MBL fold hydrolase [Lyngbya aestuarii]ERT08255.1 metallo-beta-lactamase superfamily protein [Lyngbya aestuarii BL J]